MSKVQAEHKFNMWIRCVDSGSLTACPLTGFFQSIDYLQFFSLRRDLCHCGSSSTSGTSMVSRLVA